jgi:hypothetical protein
LARVVEGLARLVETGALMPDVLNVAAPRPVAMQSLLGAAGRPFEWRDAPAGARQTITVDVTRLCHLIPLADADSDPLQMLNGAGLT